MSAKTARTRAAASAPSPSPSRAARSSSSSWLSAGTVRPVAGIAASASGSPSGQNTPHRDAKARMPSTGAIG